MIGTTNAGVFRSKGGARLPLSSNGEHDRHVYYSESRQSAGVGCMTSRRPGQSMLEIIIQSRLRRKGIIK